MTRDELAKVSALQVENALREYVQSRNKAYIFSQRELAERSGVSTRTLTRWLCDGHCLTTPVLDKLRRAANELERRAARRAA